MLEDIHLFSRSQTCESCIQIAAKGAKSITDKIKNKIIEAKSGIRWKGIYCAAVTIKKTKIARADGRVSSDGKLKMIPYLNFIFIGDRH